MAIIAIGINGDGTLPEYQGSLPLEIVPTGPPIPRDLPRPS